jgi:hypothetical protein
MRSRPISIFRPVTAEMINMLMMAIMIHMTDVLSIAQTFRPMIAFWVSRSSRANARRTFSAKLDRVIRHSPAMVSNLSTNCPSSLIETTFVRRPMTDLLSQSWHAKG